MMAKELITDLRILKVRDLDQALNYIADHLTEAQLAGGGRIIDAGDCKQWLSEIAAELRK